MDIKYIEVTKGFYAGKRGYIKRTPANDGYCCSRDIDTFKVCLYLDIEGRENKTRKIVTLPKSNVKLIKKSILL
jgi:hypothetical protein